MNAGSGTIPRATCTREWARQYLIGTAAVLLLVFTTGPLLGHHFLEGAIGRTSSQHLLDLCLVALSQLLRPVHQGFHILLLGGLVYAAADRARALRRLRRTLTGLPCSPPDDSVALACRRAGVPSESVAVVHGLAAPAFTAGLIRPRIYIAAEAAAILSQQELVAVLAHEQAHRLRRDPLRRTLWRFLSTMLFFVPAIRRLADDLADEAEIAADDYAVRHARVEPLALASALVASARAADDVLVQSIAASGLLRDELLDRRVRRLAGENSRASTHLTRSSLAVGVVTLGSLWLSGLIGMHAGTVSSHADHASFQMHCAHEHASALSHLFCLHSERKQHTEVDTSCPHAAGRHTASMN